MAQPLNYFFCGCVKSRVHDNGKPKTGQQLGQYVIEGAAGVGNEMEHIRANLQWHHALQHAGSYKAVMLKDCLPVCFNLMP